MGPRRVQLLMTVGDGGFRRRDDRPAQQQRLVRHRNWPWQHRSLDFNGDGRVDIAPQWYAAGPYEAGPNVMAWLNDGTGRFAVLKNTEFDDIDATLLFANGVAVRAAGGFKYMEFFGDGTHLEANAGVVVSGAVIRQRY